MNEKPGIPLSALQARLKSFFEEPKNTPKGISFILDNKLKNRQVFPVNIPSFCGFPATLTTSERVHPAFFDSVKAEKPDGYIVGVGVGAS